MPGRRRSVDTMERDAEAADLFRQGLTYRQICAQMGWASPNAAFEAVRRAARDAARDPLAAGEALQMMLDRLQDYRRHAYKVLTTTHYVVTQSGKLVDDPRTGLPMTDDAPVLASLDRLARIEAEEAKLLGLYAPAQSRIEVITMDAVESEIRKLEAELGQRGREQAGAPPLPA